MTESFGGMIHDSSFQTKLGCITKWFKDFHWINVEGAPNDMNMLGAGTPSIGASSVAAAELAGLLMDTDDEAYTLVDVPGELWYADLDKDIHAQVICEVGEASKANIDWGVWVKGVAAGAAHTDAKVSADGSATFAAQSNTSVGEVVVTERKALNVAGVFNSDSLLQVAVELMDKGTASADAIRFWGLRLWFTVEFASSTGVRQRT